MSYMERSSDPYGRRKLYSQHFNERARDGADRCGMVIKELDTGRPVFLVPLCLNRWNWLDVVQATEQLRDGYQPYNPRHMWNGTPQ